MKIFLFSTPLATPAALLFGGLTLLAHDVTSQSAEWESALVDAWKQQSDCSPATGICAACGEFLSLSSLDKRFLYHPFSHLSHPY